MFEIIKKMVGKTAAEQAGDEEKPLDTDIALCALLLEAAHADGECSEEEKKHVVATLISKYGVDRDEIEELIALGYRERQDSVDIFRFTRYLNNTFSKDEKLAVMESVWRIIHVDGRLEAHEDQLAHKLANLLRLTHSELIDCKIKARQ